MDVLLQAMSWLIIAPWAATLIGLLWFGLWRWRRSRCLLLTASMWLVYSIYETLMYLRITCSGECNIRIDLLLIYPLLALCTAIALVLLMLPRRAARSQ